MPAAEQRISLRRFIVMCDLLDQAFAGPLPTPDHLAHECELAERALMGAGASVASTEDPVLARLFALTHRSAAGCD